MSYFAPSYFSVYYFAPLAAAWALPFRPPGRGGHGAGGADPSRRWRQVLLGACAAAALAARLIRFVVLAVLVLWLLGRVGLRPGRRGGGRPTRTATTSAPPRPGPRAGRRKPGHE